MSRILYPNFGAEENRDAKRAVPELLHLLSLWQGLFPDDTTVHLPLETFPPGTIPLAPAAVRTGAPDAFDGALLPAADLANATKVTDAMAGSGRAMGPSRSTRLWERLADTGGIVAWYPSARAEEYAKTRGVRLAFATPDIASRLHDKASCVRWLERWERLPRSIRKSSEGTGDELGMAVGRDVPTGWRPSVLDPEDLRRPDAAEVIAHLVAGWDAACRDAFVLKPRFGTSGRGRVRGDSLPLGESIRRALPRLADRGGAVLEPWFQRLDDLSAQFWVEPDGSVTCLGTTRQVLGENGIYLGNRGEVDLHPRSTVGPGLLAPTVTSGSPWDTEFRAIATCFVTDAAATGFRGPCGVDGFAYRDSRGEERLRPLVECNARFTAGTIAVAWLSEVLASRGVASGAGSGVPGEQSEWWFAPFPTHARRLLGARGVPNPNEGWELTCLEAADDGAILGLRPARGGDR
ncbi:MAG: hypothetical protein R3E97_04575 [Candidatus Eisenbacteria bacterium]